MAVTVDSHGHKVAELKASVVLYCERSKSEEDGVGWSLPFLEPTPVPLVPLNAPSWLYTLVDLLEMNALRCVSLPYTEPVPSFLTLVASSSAGSAGAND